MRRMLYCNKLFSLPKNISPVVIKFLFCSLKVLKDKNKRGIFVRQSAE